MKTTNVVLAAAAAVLTIAIVNPAQARVTDPCSEDSECAEGRSCYLGACFDDDELVCNSDNECLRDLGVQTPGSGMCLKDGVPVAEGEQGTCAVLRTEECTDGEPGDASRSWSCPSNAVCAETLDGDACWFPANVCDRDELCADASGYCIAAGSVDVCVRRPLCEGTADDHALCFDEGAEGAANPECEVDDKGDVQCPDDGSKFDDPGATNDDAEQGGCAVRRPGGEWLGVGLLLLLPFVRRRETP